MPDLPGCVSCGDTLDERRVNIREAVQLHLDLLRRHGEPVPAPSVMVDSVVVA